MKFLPIVFPMIAHRGTIPPSLVLICSGRLSKQYRLFTIELHSFYRFFFFFATFYSTTHHKKTARRQISANRFSFIKSLWWLPSATLSLLHSGKEQWSHIHGHDTHSTAGSHGCSSTEDLPHPDRKAPWSWHQST